VIAIRRPSNVSGGSRYSNPVPQITLGSPSNPKATALEDNGPPLRAPLRSQTNAQTAKAPRSWYQTGAGLKLNAPALQHVNPFDTTQGSPRTGSATNLKASLWAPTTDRLSLDRSPLTTADGRIIPAIVDPYSSDHSDLAGKQFSPAQTPAYGNSHVQLRPRSAVGRRHSSFGIAGEVLAASPLRLPLRTEDHTASTKRPAGSMTPPESHTPQIQQSSIPDPMSQGRFSSFFPTDEDNVAITIAERAEARAKDNVGSRTPFFLWKTHSEPTTVYRSRPYMDSIVTRLEHNNGTDSRRGTMSRIPQPHAAHDILSDIDSFIAHGKYHDASKFNVSPGDYEDVVNKKPSEVMDLLQVEVQESARPSFELGPDRDDPSTARRQFADSKLRLLLGVQGFVACFVDQDQVEAKVLGKIWGLLYALCEVQLEQVSVIQSRTLLLIQHTDNR
jgi:hypothetical protein